MLYSGNPARVESENPMEPIFTFSSPTARELAYMLKRHEGDEAFLRKVLAYMKGLEQAAKN